MLARFQKFFSRSISPFNTLKKQLTRASQYDNPIILEDNWQVVDESEYPDTQQEARAQDPKQTFWIKVKVAKSSVAQFLEGKNIPIESGDDIIGNFNKNLTHQLLIHLPREGLFLAEISLDKFATKKSVLIDVTDRRMNIFTSKCSTFERKKSQIGKSKGQSSEGQKIGLSRKDSKKLFDENSLEAIGYIDLPMYVNSDHVNFYLDNDDTFHIEAEIKGVLSRNLATLRNGSDDEPGDWRPEGIKGGSDTTSGVFQPGTMLRKRGSLRKRKTKECVWQIGFV